MLACVNFKEKKTSIFAIFCGNLKNGKTIKSYLTRKPWLFYSVESKLVLISKYNKTIRQLIKSLEGKNINNHK
jgi:hypothetical protein